MAQFIPINTAKKDTSGLQPRFHAIGKRDLRCNRCNLQYIGETKRRLKDRFNEHRRTIDNPNSKSKPTTAAQHFISSPNHTANDIQLIPIEKVFSNRDSIRKAREAFLILKGRTLVPDGLNIREETY